MAKMEEDNAFAIQQNFSLLYQIEQILESDPFIDEVGHIHPAQFAALNKESNVDDTSFAVGLKFWHSDHKLAISTDILFQLYKQAKGAFFDAIAQYKMQFNLLGMNEDHNSVHCCPERHNTLENDVLKHSRTLLLLSSDFGTAWNSRKLVFQKKNVLTYYVNEFQLSKLVLSYAPKSDQAWSHRRWLIKGIAGKVTDLPQILGRESELVEKIAERSKMNYRAWNHRCWLVQFMTEEQVLDELKKSRNWAGLHVADSSCFHYRRRLMTRILEDFTIKSAQQGDDSDSEIYGIWKEELAWDEVLVKRYIGREALWLYRRFLSLCWLRHVITSDEIFMENETCLVHSCLTIPNNDFDDFEAQAIHSTTYILWLANQLPRSQGAQLRKRLRLEDMKDLLEKYCPQRYFFVDEELISPSSTSNLISSRKA